jgi:pyruvate formate-lyase activating enzyme-like uncharacterized protein
MLLKKMNVSTNEYVVNKEKQRIELHPSIIEEHVELLKKYHINAFIIEEYPTKDQLEVERIPLT